MNIKLTQTRSINTTANTATIMTTIMTTNMTTNNYHNNDYDHDHDHLHEVKEDCSGGMAELGCDSIDKLKSKLHNLDLEILEPTRFKEIKLII